MASRGGSSRGRNAYIIVHSVYIIVHSVYIIVHGVYAARAHHVDTVA